VVAPITMAATFADPAGGGGRGVAASSTGTTTAEAIFFIVIVSLVPFGISHHVPQRQPPIATLGKTPTYLLQGGRNPDLPPTSPRLASAKTRSPHTPRAPLVGMSSSSPPTQGTTPGTCATHPHATPDPPPPTRRSHFLSCSVRGPPRVPCRHHGARTPPHKAGSRATTSVPAQLVPHSRHQSVPPHAPSPHSDRHRPDPSTPTRHQPAQARGRDGHAGRSPA